MKNRVGYMVLVVAAIAVLYSCTKVRAYNTADDIVADAHEVIEEMTVESLKTLMDSGEYFTLLDVRQKSEHIFGFIPGSVLIPRGSLEFRINSQDFWENEGLYLPEKNEKIIIYCKKGQRGALAAKTLMSMGYKNVYSLKGGWKEWELTYPEIYEKDHAAMEGNAGHSEPQGGGC
jgi:rhodanese-related sulfurtransferase